MHSKRNGFLVSYVLNNGNFSFQVRDAYAEQKLR